MTKLSGGMMAVSVMIVCESASPFHPIAMRWFLRKELEKPSRVRAAWRVGNFELVRSWIHSLTGVPVEVLDALKVEMPPKGFAATLVCTGSESEGGIFKWEFSSNPSEVDEPWWVKYQHKN